MKSFVSHSQLYHRQNQGGSLYRGYIRAHLEEFDLLAQGCRCGNFHFFNECPAVTVHERSHGGKIDKIFIDRRAFHHIDLHCSAVP